MCSKHQRWIPITLKARLIKKYIIGVDLKFDCNSREPFFVEGFGEPSLKQFQDPTLLKNHNNQTKCML